jgi:Raf kinase inhibitor-like YbhB/YbcL family protein
VVQSLHRHRNDRASGSRWLGALLLLAACAHDADAAGDRMDTVAAGGRASANDAIARSPVVGGRGGRGAAGAAGGGGRVSVGGAGAAAISPVAGQSGAAGVAGAGSVAGSAAAGTDAAGGGGSGGDAPVAGQAGSAAGTAAAGSSATAQFTLTPIDFSTVKGELAFPMGAYPPTNQSPAFSWSGVPADARSLALVFQDPAIGAVKWIIWDMPPTTTSLPAKIEPVAHPSEVPGSSQLGSLDNVGYAGPGSGGRQYDFTLWALRVDKLPNTNGKTTAEIFANVLPMYKLATTPPVLVRSAK